VLDVAPEPLFEKRRTRLDVTNLPHEDASFDIVLCLDVLDHVAADVAAMREILRVLTPGGWASFQCGHTRDETLLEQHLERVGFVVDVVAFARQLGDEACARYGLDPSGSILLATKPRRF
jgi:ubiquinone/menaquinone biosynthesis C-methylase UbiE